MKNKIPHFMSVICACALFMVFSLLELSCKKEQNSPTSPDTNNSSSSEDSDQTSSKGKELLQSINDQISDVESLTDFISYLHDLELSDAVASEGVTIFAPINEAFMDEGWGRKRLPDSSDVEDYIVRGVLQFKDLADGEILTTLNGNKLRVSVKGEIVTVNGVSIANQILDSSNVIIFSINGLLKKNPALRVQVIDGSTWAAGNSNGLASDKAQVYLYRSRKDYADGASPAYSAQVDVEGNAYFNEIDADTYYIVAEEGDKRNVLTDMRYYEPRYPEGIYYGFAFNEVFKSQEEVEGSATQPNARPGNFKLVDANSDGVLDWDDFVPQPYDSIVLYQGEQSSSTVLIGYSNNMGMRPLEQQADLQAEFMKIYTASADLFLTMTMVDGYLSDDADAIGSEYPWSLLAHFAYKEETPLFREIWDRAYFQIILPLNRIIRDLQDIPGLPSSEKEDLLAQAQFLRANSYWQLVPYFGSIPFLGDEILLSFEVGDTPSEDIYDQIIEDLLSALNGLPERRSEQEAYRPNKAAAEGLLAKVYFQQRDYAHAGNYAQSVIHNIDYQLLWNEADAFKTPFNSEVIWNISGLSTILPFFSTYFKRGPYCPAIHLTEMYLIEAESLLNQSGVIPPEMIASINAFYTRTGNSPILSMETHPRDAEAILHTTWRWVMLRQGGRFLSLKRWDMTQEVLDMKGFRPHLKVLPAPLWYLEGLPNLLQKPGY